MVLFELMWTMSLMYTLTEGGRRVMQHCSAYWEQFVVQRLAKVTSTSGQKDPRIKQPTLQLSNNPLSYLRHVHQICCKDMSNDDDAKSLHVKVRKKEGQKGVDE